MSLLVLSTIKVELKLFQPACRPVFVFRQYKHYEPHILAIKQHDSTCCLRHLVVSLHFVRRNDIFNIVYSVFFPLVIFNLSYHFSSTKPQFLKQESQGDVKMAFPFRCRRSVWLRNKSLTSLCALPNICPRGKPIQSLAVAQIKSCLKLYFSSVTMFCRCTGGDSIIYFCCLGSKERINCY